MEPDTSPNPSLYQIPKGVLSAAKILDGVTGAYVDLGNCTNLTVQPTKDAKEHYASRQALKELDSETVIQTGLDIAATLDEFSKENLRMFFYGNIETGGVISVNQNPNQYYALRFISDNAAGPNYNYDIWKCKMDPAGALNLIGDDYNTMQFSGKGFSDRLNHPESPFMDIASEGSTTTTTSTTL